MTRSTSYTERMNRFHEKNNQIAETFAHDKGLIYKQGGKTKKKREKKPWIATAIIKTFENIEL